MNDLVKEIGRKLFHTLALAFLAAYWLIGYPRIIPWALAWSAFVAAAETARLRLPGLNERLLPFFGGIYREDERRRLTGIFYTSFGALAVFVFFGDKPRIVAASLFYLVLGDAAAALVGKAFGRRKIAGGEKTLEGSLACFLTCLLVGRAMGFAAFPGAAAALAATVIELLPARWFNDNLCMPLGAAAVLRLFM